MFREAIEGVKAAKAAGFLVCSNTTIYKETDLDEIAELYEYLDALGVEATILLAHRASSNARTANSTTA